MPYPRIFSWATILFAWGINWGHCVTLELFSNQNYSGFIDKWEINFVKEEKCVKLDQLYSVMSLKTDKCVMLYGLDDCTRGGSYRFESNTNHFQADSYNLLGDVRAIQSFHVCGPLGGGSRLDVDIYSAVDYQGENLKSWRGVCNCENVPQRDHFVRSIDNHGNSMYIYNEENCRGESVFIPAGDTYTSRRKFIYKFYLWPVYMRSFRPADTVDCTKLDASIYKFTFSNGSVTGGIEEDVKMASTQTIINIGALPLTQVIEFSKSTSNTVEYTVAHAFTQVHSAGVKVGVETESNAGVPFVFGAKLKLSLEANYQYTNTHQSSDTNTTSYTEAEMVKIATSVSVAACEKCEVIGYIKIISDFPINYTAEAMIKGTSGEHKLTAEEIRPKIPPGMKYLKDYDLHNVQVSVENSMHAEFAWKTFVSKTCGPVLDCKHQMNGVVKKTHEVYEVPFVVVNQKMGYKKFVNKLSSNEHPNFVRIKKNLEKKSFLHLLSHALTH